MPPIPPPRAHGMTTTTAVPLYWAAWGPEGAPRLLVLHGGPGAHHDYLLPQMLHVADRYEVVLYDQRGGGRSKTDDPAPVTAQGHVSDLVAVVAELGLAPLSLVGYSWGAMLAMLATIDGRVRPARLVLIDPAPLNRTWREQFEAEFSARMRGPVVTALREELAASGLKERDPAAYKQRAFELSVAGYFAHPERANDLTPFRVMGRVQASTWASLGDFDLTRSLGSVRVPALVVHGRQDPIPLASSEAAARALGAEFVVLEECGHVPYVEQPAALFAALDRFLAATDAAATP
ncbi:MAG: alpha/beta hydrolase [Gemmatimonadetes bacterium]|nr:alpha/beta hydrolase [Gemmatimonadota bacterium]